MKDFLSGLKQISRKPWLPWAMLLVTVLILFLDMLSRQEWIGGRSTQNLILLGFFLIIGGLLIYLIFSRMAELYDQREQLRLKNLAVELRSENTAQRLEAISRLGGGLLEASTETQITELVMPIAIELVGAVGATFVPIDENSQPLNMLPFGDVPSLTLSSWMEFLGSPETRDRCGACKQYGHLVSECSLLKGSIHQTDLITCLPVRRGEREYGIINLYFDKPVQMDNSTRLFLGALVDVTALAIESVALRRKELDTLRQIQAVRQQTDLEGLLGKLLHSVIESLEADFAVLQSSSGGQHTDSIDLSIGATPIGLEDVIHSVLVNTRVSGVPTVFGKPDDYLTIEDDSLTIAAIPLITSEQEKIGAILIGARRSEPFNQRQMSLIHTVAIQIALAIQNQRLMRELEYHTMIAERKRLAREIHDGLAQTLGFLKLQAAQMRSSLENLDIERLRAGMELYYTTLSEAYHEARIAIDGLRIEPNEAGLYGWLETTVDEFKNDYQMNIQIRKFDLDQVLPVEIQAQLIRIVQEAFSNIRKHAQAQAVWIDCYEFAGDVLFEIHDNGIGFSPEDVRSGSQHGLRGMRERSELIGADFQVISAPNEGTTIKLRLPYTWKLGQEA